jgi:hypothetical protein
MQISSFPQGSPEWLNERSGAITASCFEMAITKVNGLNEQQRTYVQALLEGRSVETAKGLAGYKSAPTAQCIQKALDLRTLDVGEYSDKAKDYAFRLACERIAKQPLADEFETYAMRRGREYEEGCRLLHEDALGYSVQLATFVKTDDGHFGCTPDALAEDDELGGGGAEYKCFYAADKVRPILLEDDWGVVKAQVQGCLWLTGLKWWDQCLYFPALRPVGMHFKRLRVARDEQYIETLEAELVAFDRLVEDFVTRICATGSR